MRQQVMSVETLFPVLSQDGTYLVEDCPHLLLAGVCRPRTRRPTFIEWVKARIDDLNAYHFSQSEQLQAPWQTDLEGLHIYDSVVVLNKNLRAAPFGELSGTKEFINYGRGIGVVHLELLATRDAAIAHEADAVAQAADVEAQAAANAERSREELRVLRSEWAQTRSDLTRVRSDLESLRQEHAQMSSALLGSWGIIREMRQSKSWQVTAPLRRARSVVSRR